MYPLQRVNGYFGGGIIPSPYVWRQCIELEIVSDGEVSLGDVFGSRPSQSRGGYAFPPTPLSCRGHEGVDVWYIKLQFFPGSRS